MGGGAWPFLVGGVICLVNKNIVSDIGQKEVGSARWRLMPSSQESLQFVRVCCFFS